MIKFIAIILLLVGLLVGLYLLTHPTSFFSKAAPEITPKEVKISNVSDNSFTVSWITLDKQTLGVIYYGTTSSLGQVTQDDRDEGGPKARFTHHVTIKKLDPNTVYYYKIGSGPKSFDNNGKPYTQTTASPTENPPAVPDPLFGKIATSANQEVDEAIVYITPEKGSLLSSYTRDGKWLITLNNARSDNLKTYLNISKDTKINLFIQAGKRGTASVNASYDQKDKFSLIKLTPNVSP